MSCVCQFSSEGDACPQTKGFEHTEVLVGGVVGGFVGGVLLTAALGAIISAVLLHRVRSADSAHIRNGLILYYY